MARRELDQQSARTSLGRPSSWTREPEKPPRFAMGTREMGRIPKDDVEPDDIDIARSIFGDTLAQIVHDLKNPLSTIGLEACLLKEIVPEGGQRDAVARIAHNVNFLDRLVQDLLDSCSVEAGKFELHRRPTELRTLLEQTIERVVATRDRHRVFLEARDSIVLAIDDLRIERVVANLLGNALAYSPRSAGVVIRLVLEADHVRVAVIDAGPGMSPTEAQVVFEKYRRGSAPGAGSGLGLHVSKVIVEAHGGRIGVASVRGAGSQFYFELPIV